MRLFISIELPDEVKRHLSGIAASFAAEWGAAAAGSESSRANVFTLTREENLHITLKFLGEVPDEDVSRLRDALSSVPPAGSIPLQIGGVQCFPRIGWIRVVALKVGGDVGRLALLHRGMDEACRGLGLSSEKREFRPHITIARSRDGVPRSQHEIFWRKSGGDSPAKRDEAGPVFEATEFVLMQSRLQKTGPLYTAVACFPLEPQPDRVRD